MAQRLDLPKSVRGVMVTRVNDEESELRAGDVIEEVNQQPVTSVAEFRQIVSSLDPNETQVLSVCRRRTRSFVVLRPR
jgi:S1-C subfamily serine protease